MFSFCVFFRSLDLWHVLGLESGYEQTEQYVESTF